MVFPWLYAMLFVDNAIASIGNDTNAVIGTLASSSLLPASLAVFVPLNEPPDCGVYNRRTDRLANEPIVTCYSFRGIPAGLVKLKFTVSWPGSRFVNKMSR